MAEQSNFKLNSPRIKFGLEIKKNTLECIEAVCRNLGITYTVKDNPKFKTMVTVEFYVNHAELFWLGYHVRDCDRQYNFQYP